MDGQADADADASDSDVVCFCSGFFGAAVVRMLCARHYVVWRLCWRAVLRLTISQVKCGRRSLRLYATAITNGIVITARPPLPAWLVKALDADADMRWLALDEWLGGPRYRASQGYKGADFVHGSSSDVIIAVARH